MILSDSDIYPHVIGLDVGATNVRAARKAIGSPAGQIGQVLRTRTETAESLVEFLKVLVLPSTLGVCLAVPGPVNAGKVTLVNANNMELDAAFIKQQIGVEQVTLINDLAGHTAGAPLLQDEDFKTVFEGSLQSIRGTYAVIAPGTGLGVGWGTAEGRILMSEGGHHSLAPRNQIQIDYLRWLMDRYNDEHISYERGAISGIGLPNIYSWLSGALPDSTMVIDAAEVQAKAEQSEPLAILAMKTFCRIYGQYVGNQALSLLCDTIYLGGNSSRILLQGPLSGTLIQEFVAGYLDRGRVRHVAEATSVKVIQNPDVGIIGAANLAENIAGSK